MKDIDQDDERLYNLMQKQKLHQAEMSMKKGEGKSEDVIKKYENILVQKFIIDDLIRKWSPVLDKLPDE